MPTPWQRDLEADGAKLADWIRARLPGASKLAMSPLVSPTSSGFSNETLLFEIDYEEEGEARHEDLVARVQPIGFQAFPSYDLSLQYRTMELLAPTDVPVPEMRWLGNDDTSVFNAPFYIMRQVKGRVPSDSPPYTLSGWLAEATPEEQAEVWWAGIEAQAKIHKLDYKATGFEFLDHPEDGAAGLEQQLAHYDRYFEWASCGRPQPTVEGGW